MPTGSGKTRTAAEIILDFIRLSSSKSLLSEKMKVLWIAQSAELCFQAFETVKWIIEKKGTKDIRIGHFYENYTINEAELDGTMIVFAGIQKLLQHYQSGLWNKIRNETFLVVVDEAHRSIATQWIRALDSFVSNASVYLIGLTATPGAGNESDERNFALSTYYYGNKFSLMDKNCPLTIRATSTHMLQPTATNTCQNPLPNNNVIAITKSKVGMAQITFTNQEIKESILPP
jgi:superfamily II DNA or RNA helicase